MCLQEALFIIASFAFKMFVFPFSIPFFAPEIASVYMKKFTYLGDLVGQENHWHLRRTTKELSEEQV